MRIFKLTGVVLALAAASTQTQAVEAWSESFETDGDGVRYTASIQFNDGVNDHFQRTDGSDISNVTGPYTSMDGTFFWAAEDVNDNGGNGLSPQTIDFTGINIAGLNNLVFSGLFGAGNENLPGNSHYDAADFVRVSYQIDGGGYTDGLCFGYENHGDVFNEPFGLDADCDGEADATDGSVRLGTALQAHGFAIPVTGSTLDLRIEVAVESGSEEFAFDLFAVNGDLTGSDTPPRVVSTTPANGSSGFVGSDNVVLNLNETVDASINAITFNCSQSGAVSFTGLPVSGSDVITLDPAVTLIDSEVCTVTALAAEISDNDGTPDPLDGNGDGTGGDDFVLTFTVDYPVAEIFEIQGSGLTSPYADQVVRSNANIVTALDTDGFYMQTPDGRDDADVFTSNGIFVYTGSAPTVSVGDQVNVLGEVIEFFEFTEFSNGVTVDVLTNGNLLPTAILLNDAFPSNAANDPPCGAAQFGFECFEGMHFEMPQGFISSAYVGFFGANRDDVLVRAGSARAFREPGIEHPGLPGLPVWDGNPELLEMDIDALTLPLTTFNAGTEVAIEGVFGFDFGEYELWPSAIVVLNDHPLPQPVRAPEAYETTVASVNLFRLFNDVDDPGPEDDGQVEDPLVYAARLAKISNYIRNDLGAPVIIALQEIENIDVLNDLATRIGNDGGPAYTAQLVEGNDVGGIDVGFLYTSAVSAAVFTQLGAAELLSVDNSLLHDRPPLHMQADITINAETMRLHLLAIHMRSRSSIDDTGPDGDRVRQKRLEQANSVAQMVNTIETNNPGEGVVVLGDFNAFQFTDGYVDLVGQITGTAQQADNERWTQPLFVGDPMIQAVHTLLPADQYSFLFGGSAQVLDNALFNNEGLFFFNTMQYARGQSDAPLLHEDDDLVSLRSTDHDGFVLYLSLQTDLIFKNGVDD